MKASPLLHAMSFSANNRYFEPARTSCDWLSRDTAEVDAYIADPLCGFVCSFDFYRALFSGLSLYLRPSPFAKVDKTLPVYIFSGAEDPIGGAKGFVPVLAEMLRKAGLADVETRLYPGARHETLNETNHSEVVEDLKKWLVERIERAALRTAAS
jgi:alpha-beta hydrolase superfamily lysophospholipase